MSLAAMAHLAKGPCPNSLLMLKVENSLIFLVGTRIPTVSLKTSIRDIVWNNSDDKTITTVRMG
jgi:hypothetical protein